MPPSNIDEAENHARMLRGELYYCFTPGLIADRARTTQAVNRFNDTRETTRRHRVELWRGITRDSRPLPPVLPSPEADAAQFDATDPWVEPPFRCDYGTQIHIAPGSFVNFNATFIDTLPITIGARVLCGPGCSFYSGTHPLDPMVRNGADGPEMGRAVVIEDDCWLGGNVIILPGVTVGKGSVVGAGSVVTKDVPPFHVVAGNPARIIRKIETAMDPTQHVEGGINAKDAQQGAEGPMEGMAE